MAIMIVIALIQLPLTMRRRRWRELVAFGVIWLFATVYGALVIADVPVPKPTELITTFFEGVTGNLTR